MAADEDRRPRARGLSRGPRRGRGRRPAAGQRRRGRRGHRRDRSPEPPLTCSTTAPCAAARRRARGRVRARPRGGPGPRADTAAEITGARYAALGILDEHRDGLERFLTHGVSSDARAIGEPPRGRGLLGALIADPRPLRIDRVSDDPRASGFPAGHPPMETFLGVPILIRGEAWGNLYLCEKGTASRSPRPMRRRWWCSPSGRRSRSRTRACTRAERRASARPPAGGDDRDRSRARRRDRPRADPRADRRARARADRRARSADPAARGRRAGRRRLRGRGAATACAAGGPARSTRSGWPAATACSFRSCSAASRSGCSSRSARRGDGDDEQLLQAFAASAATAVATARTVEEQRLRDAMHAAEEERRRWARELHDDTLQGLGGLRMLLSAAARSGDPERLRAAVDGRGRANRGGDRRPARADPRTASGGARRARPGRGDRRARRARRPSATASR